MDLPPAGDLSNRFKSNDVGCCTEPDRIKLEVLYYSVKQIWWLEQKLLIVDGKNEDFQFEGYDGKVRWFRF